MKPLTAQDKYDIEKEIRQAVGDVFQKEMSYYGAELHNTTALRYFLETEVSEAIKLVLNRYNASQKRTATIATARQRTGEQQKLAADAKKLAAKKK